MSITVTVTHGNKDWAKAEEERIKNGLRAVNRGALSIHAEIVKSFVGPKSGRKYKKGGKTHTASAPGEAPARDTGHLGQSTGFKLVPVDPSASQSVAQVYVAAEYALALEFGRQDGTIKARPFVRPAWNKLIPGIREAIKKALSK